MATRPSIKHLCICKPGSVSRFSAEPPSSIWDEGHPSPLSAYPPECGLRHKDGRSTSTFRRTSGIHGLSAREVYQATTVASNAGGLLLHAPKRAIPREGGTTFSPLPPPFDGSAVSLSAALSVTPPSPVMFLPVRKHGALRCPDFPPSHCWKSDGAMHRI